MLNNLFNSVFGAASNAPQAMANTNGNFFSQQAMNQAQAAQQQQIMYNQQLQMAYGLARQRHEWMVNGVTMTFDEFLDAVCPDADDPHRTFLTLKYKGIK